MGGAANTIPMTRGFDRFLLAARSHNCPVLIRWIGLLPTERYGWKADVRQCSDQPSISILPDRMNSRKLIPRQRNVCWMLSSVAYSRVPLGVFVLIPFRRRVKARTACSTLLLFQGTPS